jgi:hypothetical protein
MLRRIIPTAERTVTRGSKKRAIDKGDAIRERPSLARVFGGHPETAQAASGM